MDSWCAEGASSPCSWLSGWCSCCIPECNLLIIMWGRGALGLLFHAGKLEVSQPGCKCVCEKAQIIFWVDWLHLKREEGRKRNKKNFLHFPWGSFFLYPGFPRDCSRSWLCQPKVCWLPVHGSPSSQKEFSGANLLYCCSVILSSRGRGEVIVE